MKPAKVVSFEDAGGYIHDMKTQGWGVVLTQGVFDIVHRGHVDYLRKSSMISSKTLIVIGVENDDSVRKNKGTTRPINPCEDRMHVLSEWRTPALIFSYTDAPNYDRASDFIARYRLLRPSLIATSKWDPHIKLKQVQAKIAGSRIAAIDNHYDNSTTQMLQKLGYKE